MLENPVLENLTLGNLIREKWLRLVPICPFAGLFFQLNFFVDFRLHQRAAVVVKADLEINQIEANYVHSFWSECKQLEPRPVS